MGKLRIYEVGKGYKNGKEVIYVLVKVKDKLKWIDYRILKGV